MFPQMMWILPALTACVLAFALTPLARRAALAVGLVDVPNTRRLNTRPMPTGGGVAVFAAFFVTAGVLGGRELLPFILGGLIVLIVGLIDDYRGLSAPMKFGGQVLAALVFAWLGPRIEFVTNPWGGMIYVGTFAVPLTVLWMVSVVNVINFIDGMDGLAAGITGIAALSLLAISMEFGRYDPAVLSLILIGACVGFLPYNFNPAKVYLGDAGAMFLGFMLAGIATDGALKGAATIGMTVPTLILFVPVFDTACAIVRRLQRGMPVYQADKEHFHHRMLALGLSQRQTALLAYFLSFLTGFAGLYLLRSDQGCQLVVGIIVILFAWGALRVGLISGPDKLQKRMFR